MALGVGEAFHQQIVRPRHLAAPILHFQPFAHVIGKARPARAIGQQRAHPVCQMGGERQPQPAIGRNHRRFRTRPDDQLHVFELFHFNIHAAELECVTGAERSGKALLHPAQRSAIAETHFEHFGVDNDARIHPVAMRLLRMREPPRAIRFTRYSLEFVVSPQRVSAGCDEFEHAAPHIIIDLRIGPAGTHLGEQCPFLKRSCAGAGHHMLGEHIEPAGAKIFAIALALIHRFHRCGCFEKLETIARHQQRAAGLVEPMIGAANALQQAARTLGRTHLHHQINIAPIHAQIEAGGANQCAQFAARHRIFNLAPRLLGQ